MTAACPTRLTWSTLTCTREDGHSGAHVFVGSEAPDRHSDEGVQS